MMIALSVEYILKIVRIVLLIFQMLISSSKKRTKCCACIKIYQVAVKAFNHKIMDNLKDFLINNFTKVRREPEIFIT